jgi:hypothetical protein
MESKILILFTKDNEIQTTYSPLLKGYKVRKIKIKNKKSKEPIFFRNEKFQSEQISDRSWVLEQLRHETIIHV